MPDTDKASRPKVSVAEHGVLVAPGQSKKLAAMRKKFQPEPPVETAPSKRLLTGVKPEVADELDKARTLIDDRINQIMRSYPEGKKNKLFCLRFGSVDKVKTMSIKAAFKTLGIDDHSVKMKSIAALDVDGNEVKVR